MQQEELGRLAHWLLAFVDICWAVAIFSGRGHLALCLRGVTGLNVFLGHCTSAHCWNFFYYKISVFCLWAPPALFIIQASSGSSISGHLESAGRQGGCQGLSCAWFPPAGLPELSERAHGALWNLCYLFLNYLCDVVMLLSCHIGQRDWQRSFISS